MRLTQDQIDQFHQDGFLAVGEGLTATDLDPLIEDLETLIDEVAREWLAEGKIKDLHADEPFERRIASLTHAAGEPVQPRISFPANLRLPLFDFLHNASLLDLLEGLVGPEIYCNPTHHIRPKLPEVEGSDSWIQKSPFHQDAAVLMPEADATLIVTTWIPLVDATAENGTLQVFPGLHRGPIRRHERCPYGWQIAPDLLPQGDPLTLPAARGDLILLHCRTPHGSLLNRSNEVRWSLDLRWHDARKPGGRPLPGIHVRSRVCCCSGISPE